MHRFIIYDIDNKNLGIEDINKEYKDDDEVSSS